MSRRPIQPPIPCAFFAWYLRRKSNGVYFADGRLNRGFKLGKPSLGTRNYDEALRRLHQLDQAMAIKAGLAKQPQTGPAGDLSIERGWKLYQERCEQPEVLGGISPGAWKRYSAVMDKHIIFCERQAIRSWGQITKQTTFDYGKYLAKALKLADSTIILELNLVCSVVKWLVEAEHLPLPCLFQLKLAKSDETSTYCYTKQQVRRMIALCDSTPELNWLCTVITALATSGLRINELARLRWTDVDLNAQTIRLTDERARPRRRQTGHERRIKGKRGRSLPMHPEFRKAVMVSPRHRDGLIFRAQRGGIVRDRIVLDTLQKKVIQVLASEYPTPDGEIGFRDGTTHGLRHYFCSEAYRNGATDAELMEWLGHRESKMLRLYRHLRPEDGHRKMQQINFLGSDDEEDNVGDVA